MENNFEKAELYLFSAYKMSEIEDYEMAKTLLTKASKEITLAQEKIVRLSE